MELEAEIDRLPIDLLAHIFVMITSFTDLAQYVSSSLLFNLYINYNNLCSSVPPFLFLGFLKI